jgi:hypothetical protein
MSLSEAHSSICRSIAATSRETFWMDKELLQRYSWIVLLLVFLSECAGCGTAGAAKVSGTLKLSDGTPLIKARITARNESTGNWASGTTNQEGHFTLGTENEDEGLPLGEYGLIVVEHRGDWDHPSPPKISRKYENPATSGLQLQIDSGESQVLDLVMDPA